MPGYSSSKVMMACGVKFCLARVVWSATITEVKIMLPGYTGVVGQDSNTIWLHTGGDRQFCMQHQRRLSKKDIKHLNLKGDPLEFLTALKRLDYKYTTRSRTHTPAWLPPGAWKRSAANCCAPHTQTPKRLS